MTRKSDKKESVDLSDIPPLEGYAEEVKQGKGLKMLTPNKWLIRPQITSEIKSWKQLIQIKKRNQTNTLSFVSAL